MLLKQVFILLKSSVEVGFSRTGLEQGLEDTVSSAGEPRSVKRHKRTYTQVMQGACHMKMITRACTRPNEGCAYIDETDCEIWHDDNIALLCVMPLYTFCMKV